MPTDRKKGWKKVFFSRLFLIGIFALFVLVSLAYGRAYYRDLQVKEEIQKLQDETVALEAKKIKSLEMLDYVKSTDFVETKARQELNLLKPGEQVAVFAKSEEEPIRQVDKKVVISDSLWNPLKWWKFFTEEKDE
jgi:cell division protein FtsB